MSNVFDENLYSQMFSRNELVLGKENFEKLVSTRIAVVGIGGVGSVVCEQLTRLGIKQLLFFARGCYDLGNVNRQIPATYVTVKSKTRKVHALAQRLIEINPFIELLPKERDVVSENHTVRQELDEFSPQVIFNCVDEIKAQFLIAENAADLNCPFLIGGATGIGLEGIVSLFSSTSPKYKDVFGSDLNDDSFLKTDTYRDGNVKEMWLNNNWDSLALDIQSKFRNLPNTPYPVLTPVPWLVAGIMIFEFIKMRLNVQSSAIAPNAWYIRPWENQISVVSLTQQISPHQFFPWRP